MRRICCGEARTHRTGPFAACAMGLVAIACSGGADGGAGGDSTSPDDASTAPGGDASAPQEGSVPVPPGIDGSDGQAAADGSMDTGGDAGDPYLGVFNAVDKTTLIKELKDATGGNPVTVNGKTMTLSERWSPAGKANWRAFFTQFWKGLGATVDVTTFPENILSENAGHNVEAVLPGQSADSVVIIVHYDSVGISGQETQNPAVDDDGTGCAMMMEAGRIFSQIKNRKNTVRFVGADYEEISGNLDGDYAYVQYLQGEAKAKGFKILVASDNDQTGWSCWDEDVSLCDPYSGAPNTTFQMAYCSGDSNNYNYPELLKGITSVAKAFSPKMKVTGVCDGSATTDHYPFWVAGIPAYVLDEWGNNPHYDSNGGDTFNTINQDYFFHIAQIQIAYQAKLMGIGP